MIRTILWFTYFWLYLIYIMPPLIKVKLLERRGDTTKIDEIAQNVARNWARALVNFSGSKINVIGEENIPESGAVLFVSNHQGNFDIPILLGFIDKPKGFIAKMEVKKLPLIGTWMKYIYCVFMNRDDIRQSLKAINQGADYLKQGHSLVIFPEGTRSKGDSMGEFKPGSIKLATKSGVPIVPITVKGSYRIMEQNGFIIKPSEVEIIISPPVETQGLSKEEMSGLADKVRDIIASKL